MIKYQDYEQDNEFTLTHIIIKLLFNIFSIGQLQLKIKYYKGAASNILPILTLIELKVYKSCHMPT